MAQIDSDLGQLRETTKKIKVKTLKTTLILKDKGLQRWHKAQYHEIRGGNHENEVPTPSRWGIFPFI